MVCLQVAHPTLIVDRVEVMVKIKQKPTPKLIPDPPTSSMKEICAEVDKVHSSRIALSRYAELQKPLQKRSCPFKESFTCIMAATRPREESFSSDS